MTTTSIKPGLRSPRDAWIPWAFVGFFLLVFAANGLMLFIAFDSWTGVSTEDAYLKGLSYNDEIDTARAQDALGWRGDFVFRQYGAHQGRAEFALQDLQGRPLDGAVVRAMVLRPTLQGYDFDVAFRPRGEGRYAAELNLPLAGLWEVRVTAVHPRGTYRRTERVLVP